MNYKYYILVQGLKDDKWIDLKYKIGSASYTAEDSHYFYKHRHDYKLNHDEFNEDMGVLKYIFYYDDIENDYMKYKDCYDICIWELMKWYTVCQNYKSDYDDIRIVYGTEHTNGIILSY